jgi:DNA transformation protein and related proteins
MKTDAGTVEFLCEQLAKAGTIRQKKMFGEYGLYCNEIFIALVCQNKLFFKATDELKKLMTYDGLKPYEGAVDGYWHVDESLWDDTEQLVLLATAATKYTPKPKKIKKL